MTNAPVIMASVFAAFRSRFAFSVSLRFVTWVCGLFEDCLLSASVVDFCPLWAPGDTWLTIDSCTWLTSWQICCGVDRGTPTEVSEASVGDSSALLLIAVVSSFRSSSISPMTVLETVVICGADDVGFYETTWQRQFVEYNLNCEWASNCGWDNNHLPGIGKYPLTSSVDV